MVMVMVMEMVKVMMIVIVIVIVMVMTVIIAYRCVQLSVHRATGVNPPPCTTNPSTLNPYSFAAVY